MRRFARACVLLTIVAIACARSADDTPAPSSVVTSLRAADCFAPPEDIRAQYASRDLGVQECRGYGEWRVFLVSSDANAWVELRSAERQRSFEEATVYESPIGLFPGVHAASGVEWRLDGRGMLKAVIFTVSAQDPADASSRVTRVFVARVDDRRACIVGRFEALDEARAVADGPLQCDAS